MKVLLVECEFRLNWCVSHSFYILILLKIKLQISLQGRCASSIVECQFSINWSISQSLYCLQLYDFYWRINYLLGKWLIAQEQPPEAVEINPVSYDQEMKVQFSYFPCFSYVLRVPILTLKIFNVIGVYYPAWQGYEQPQQPLCSWDTSHAWAAMGKRVGWY